MSRQTDAVWPLFGLWLLVVITSLWLRPLLPVDETRYASVAWEMWLRGDFLVPFKNGTPYPDKPPLLFWLINLGWWPFEVNDWWPRLVSPLLALACLFPMNRLARSLWPEQNSVHQLAPWLLFGSLFWLGFMTLVQFDLLLVLFTLIGMLGWWRMVQTGRFSLLPGIAVGLGVLSKGPVILVHLLPVALLAPLWTTFSPGWLRWYGSLLLSVLIGAAISLAWAIPAGLSGGEDYYNAIFWGQTAHRVINSFAHQQAWWWYLPLLPLLLLPWAFWSQWWRGLIGGGFWREPPVRFLLTWFIPVLLVFSLVSGKQLKYLLPLLPALILLSARGLQTISEREARPWFAAMLLLVTGVVLATLTWWISPRAAYWLTNMQPVWGIILILAGLGILAMRSVTLLSQVQLVTLAVALVVAVANAGFKQATAGAYDLAPISRHIAVLQKNGKTVAYLGPYHAQFNFLGRLQQPIVEILHQGRDAVIWAQAHPGDFLVLRRSQWPGLGEGSEFEQAYRKDRHEMEIWRADRWLAALPDELRQPGTLK